MTSDYIIYAIMGCMLLYTVIHYEIIDHKLNNYKGGTRGRKELVREYNAIATSMLIQVGCVLVASMIIF